MPPKCGYGVCISCDNNECNPIFDTQGTTTTNVPCSAYLEIKNEGYKKSLIATYVKMRE